VVVFWFIAVVLQKIKLGTKWRYVIKQLSERLKPLFIDLFVSLLLALWCVCVCASVSVCLFFDLVTNYDININ